MKTGGQVLVDCLRAQGVKRAFGVPGESYLAVLDALYDTPEIELIGNRNEGGAAFMACAYGQLTGEPGICFVTRGPGATNASIGVHTAMQSSVPMILFVGQVDTGMRDREAFQEIDYRAFFGPVAKWATEIENADRIPEILARAFAVTKSGRPGPVVIGLPENILTDMTKAVAGPKVTIAEAAPSDASLEQLMSALGKSDRPLAIVGGTGWTSAGRMAFQRFVERNHIPVMSAFRYQDILDNRSPSFVGDAGLGKLPQAAKTIAAADLIFAVNIRFGECTTDGYSLFDVPKMKTTLIHSHADASELNKIYTADIPVFAGPNSLFEKLQDRNISTVSPDWCAQAKSDYETALNIAPQPGALDMGDVIKHLQSVLPDDAIITNGAGNFSIWHSKFFQFGANARQLAPQAGAMGYGLPAAIAAKATYPNRTVICMAGDGDFQMNMQELGAAMQHEIAPIVLIVNNGTYGTIRMHQERDYPKRVSFTDIENPDFVSIANAYNFYAESVRKTADFPDAMARAMNSQTGAVLELIVSPESITPTRTLSDIRKGQ